MANALSVSSQSSIQPDRHSHTLTISQDLNLNCIAYLMLIKRTEKIIRVCNLLAVYPKDNIAELSVAVLTERLKIRPRRFYVKTSLSFSGQWEIDSRTSGIGLWC